MISCDHISDRMPAIAAGRAAWSGEEELHLVGCETCREEWDVVRQAAQLGTDAAARLDTAAVADAVLRRLRTAPEGADVSSAGTDAGAAPRRIWRWAGVGGAAVALAASLMLFVRTDSGRAPGSVRSESSQAAEPVGAHQLALAIPELEDVPAEALDTVLRSLEPPIRADEWLESSWSDVESRAFTRGFSTVSTISLREE